MDIPAKDVKQLREETGISMMACKNALIEAGGDFEKAKKCLRTQGEKVAEKKLARNTNQGIVASYIHGDNKIGALVELHCETDFVAKNEDFKKLAKELAIQVVGYNPLYVSEDYVPEEDINEKTKLFKEEFKGQKIEGDRLEKALTSKIDKFKRDNALLSQKYFREESKTIDQFIKETVAKLGENIQIKSFTRYQI
jgi:elongation factor Ts